MAGVWFNQSCTKPNHTCANGETLILGGCRKGYENHVVFAGVQDFYCYNDSIAIAYNPLDLKYGKIIVNNYYYLDNKKDGPGQTVTSSFEKWNWFHEQCKKTFGDNLHVNTYLELLTPKEDIHQGTLEIRCRVHLGNSYAPTPDHVVSIESKDIVLKRLR